MSLTMTMMFIGKNLQLLENLTVILFIYFLFFYEERALNTTMQFEFPENVVSVSKQFSMNMSKTCLLSF